MNQRKELLDIMGREGTLIGAPEVADAILSRYHLLDRKKSRVVDISNNPRHICQYAYSNEQTKVYKNPWQCGLDDRECVEEKCKIKRIIIEEV